MENVTNFTNFEEFVAAVPQVAGQSERALTFVGIMFAIALLTQAIGTAVLFCAGMLKAPNPESDSTRLMAEIWQHISTKKDILFAFLCFAAEDAFVQALGALTLIWLVTFHIILLRDKRCQLEFASNHLAVLSLPTFSADSTDASKKAIQAKAEKVSWTKWAFSKASGMCSELLPLLYKQNVPQAALAILYLALVPGGSTVVAVLNLAVPIVQVTGTFVLFKPLQRRIAPKLASKLDAALEAADGDQVVRLKDEAGLENDAGLFREICVESHLLKEISDLIQSDSTREVTRSSTDTWTQSSQGSGPGFSRKT
eukprot:g13951.t1